MRTAIILVFATTMFVACQSSKKSTDQNVVVNNATPITADALVVERYAQYMKVSPDNLINKKLYLFIDQWINTPYKWGGMDKEGIDCSAFVQRLLEEVYDLKIPRTSIEQLLAERIEKFSSTKYCAEGDLIFFKTIEGTTVSHVGMFLHNRYFINSSSSKGVSIANLDDPYWRKRYVACGRLKVALIRAQAKL